MQNHGVTIHLNNNYRIDLQEILNAVGEVGKYSVWKISDAECFGEEDEKIHNISDKEEEISGEEFYKLVSGICQTLGGCFDAYKTKENHWWLRIRSIRGDEFDIETEDNELLDRIRKSFHDITDLVY
ncbi:MAG: hypothetical protein ACR2F2_07760 [Pyrinomonadaceae bacterium]